MSTRWGQSIQCPHGEDLPHDAVVSYSITLQRGIAWCIWKPGHKGMRNWKKQKKVINAKTLTQCNKSDQRRRANKNKKKVGSHKMLHLQSLIIIFHSLVCYFDTQRCYIYIYILNGATKSMSMLLHLRSTCKL